MRSHLLPVFMVLLQVSLQAPLIMAQVGWLKAARSLDQLGDTTTALSALRDPVAMKLHSNDMFKPPTSNIDIHPELIRSYPRLPNPKAAAVVHHQSFPPRRSIPPPPVRPTIQAKPPQRGHLKRNDPSNIQVHAAKTAEITTVLKTYGRSAHRAIAQRQKVLNAEKQMMYPAAIAFMKELKLTSSELKLARQLGPLKAAEHFMMVGTYRANKFLRAQRLTYGDRVLIRRVGPDRAVAAIKQSVAPRDPVMKNSIMRGSKVLEPIPEQAMKEASAVFLDKLSERTRKFTNKLKGKQ